MSKSLVAYFSASGVTKKVAERLAKATSSDLFEIVPERPYTDDDLNWRNENSRSSVEMKDRSSRPAISSKKDNMSDYHTIFIGFPIWWYREPSIIDTFLESCDFSGKTIIPFATSGGSGMGDVKDNFKRIAKGANVIEGKRFPSSVSERELADWAMAFLNRN
ncbi:MAG: NAD(P)H-dependent oxidoreductase [Candidatus Methanomethylophilaceae archaeon]|nr:NAD(P)H-dependent oxidoreductase [Candidatus Methanomethylophilaceae archaeon]